MKAWKEAETADIRYGAKELLQEGRKTMPIHWYVGIGGCAFLLVLLVVFWPKGEMTMEKAIASIEACMVKVEGSTFTMGNTIKGEKGNKDNFTYSGGNDLGNVAWYVDNSNETHPVGQKKPNQLGLYDLSGNVCEWCEDRYLAYPSCEADKCESCRVLRGGSWNVNPEVCRSAMRYKGPSNYQVSLFGFRLARDY